MKGIEEKKRLIKSLSEQIGKSAEKLKLEEHTLQELELLNKLAEIGKNPTEKYFFASTLKKHEILKKPEKLADILKYFKSKKDRYPQEVGRFEMLRSLLDHGSGNKKEMEEHLEGIIEQKKELISELNRTHGAGLEKHKAKLDVEQLKLIKKFMELAGVNKIAEDKGKRYILDGMLQVINQKYNLNQILSYFEDYRKKTGLNAKDVLSVMLDKLKDPKGKELKERFNDRIEQRKKERQQVEKRRELEESAREFIGIFNYPDIKETDPVLRKREIEDSMKRWDRVFKDRHGVGKENFTRNLIEFLREKGLSQKSAWEDMKSLAGTNKGALIEGLKEYLPGKDIDPVEFRKKVWNYENKAE